MAMMEQAPPTGVERRSIDWVPHEEAVLALHGISEELPAEPEKVLA